MQGTMNLCTIIFAVFFSALNFILFIGAKVANKEIDILGILVNFLIVLG